MTGLPLFLRLRPRDGKVVVAGTVGHTRDIRNNPRLRLAPMAGRQASIVDLPPIHPRILRGEPQSTQQPGTGNSAKLSAPAAWAK